MWNRCAFTVGDREYLWQDVVLAALWRGDWPAFERRLREGLACETCAYEEDDPADQDAVDTATTEFRYEHELITAEETEQWLERMELSVDIWSRYFVRQNLRTRWDDRIDDVHDTFAPDDQTVREHLIAEGICSGWLRESALALASRAAVAHDEPDAPSIEPPAVDDGRLAMLLDAHGFVLGDVAPDRVRAQVAHIAWLDATLERACARALTPEAVQAQIESSRLDWLLVDLERLSFPEASMVRETLLCCQEDDLSLAELAARIRRSVASEQVRLEDSSPDFRAMLLSAKPGVLLGPIEADEAFHAVVVRDKRLPSADDPEVRQLAETAVVDALLKRARMLHVQWKHWV